MCHHCWPVPYIFAYILCIKEYEVSYSRSKHQESCCRMHQDAPVKGRGGAVGSFWFCLFCCHKSISVGNVSKLNKATWHRIQFLVSRATQETESTPQYHPWRTYSRLLNQPVSLLLPLRMNMATASTPGDSHEQSTHSGFTTQVKPLWDWLPHDHLSDFSI